VVVLAQDEARALKHNYIGTEHLLLGLLREEDGVGAHVLESLHVTSDGVHAQVGRIVGSGEEVTTGQIPFTPRAKKVLELSLREALFLGHNHIGTEHILLGLVREGDGVAMRILQDFQLDADKIREAVIRMIPGHYPQGYPSGPLPRAPKSPPEPSTAQVVSYAPPKGRDDMTVLVTGASIATAGIGIGLALGWLIWG
jgi:ATP-dependent Clp protease ATP-binding subunit ClpC